MDAVKLDGSSSLVVEFFEYCVNSILYQRGIYPEEDFKLVEKYGVHLFTTRNDDLRIFLNDIVQQLRVWLDADKINKVILVIKHKNTMETVERWQFDIKTQVNPVAAHDQETPRTDSNVWTEGGKRQFRAIMRQIAAAVTYLPELNPEDYTINVLVHADMDADVPSTWGDTDPGLIKGGGEHMRLKELSTASHTVTPFVAYRIMEDPPQ
ncbi:DNA-binding protein [Syncephalastrum racemosum]|uniref:DNA-binding protein n=1 Tax=Syncephalastrum racemosum TaxID=13706 RepID=A0A1X2HDK4_SYNRA|nr:DNA-binding protein [Syncephalastrum racemosum]